MREWITIGLAILTAIGMAAGLLLWMLIIVGASAASPIMGGALIAGPIILFGAWDRAYSPSGVRKRPRHQRRTS